MLTPSADIRKIHLGIPVSLVATRRGTGAATREAVGSNGNPLVGIVGRLEAWKGQEVFLRAAARISASNRGTVFAVVGGVTPDKDQAYLSRLLTLAKELQLDGRVHFVGHATDVFPWFDARHSRLALRKVDADERSSLPTSERRPASQTCSGSSYRHETPR